MCAAVGLGEAPHGTHGTKTVHGTKTARGTWYDVADILGENEQE